MSTTQVLVRATAFLVGAGAGFVAGYYFTKRQYESKIDTKVAEEVAATKRFYNKVETADDVVTASIDALIGQYKVSNPFSGARVVGKQDLDEPESKPEPVVEQRIFNDPSVKLVTTEPEFDWPDELARREARPLDPYVITEEEFLQNEPENDQMSVTWYAGDGVLTDDKEQPVPEPAADALVGLENMEKFGYGTHQHSVVHVRNMRVGTDFEVKYSGMNYAREVLGYLEHSELRSRSYRRFRGDDE